jgi:hypothetical protein
MAPRRQRREIVGVLGYCTLIYRLNVKQASIIEQEVAEQAEEEETNSLLSLLALPTSCSGHVFNFHYAPQ